MSTVESVLAQYEKNKQAAGGSTNKVSQEDRMKKYFTTVLPKGDPNRQCLNLHQCIVVDDAFMKRLNDRDSEAMSLWLEILKSRVETGEPYIMFKDNVNKDNPLAVNRARSTPSDLSITSPSLTSILPPLTDNCAAK